MASVAQPGHCPRLAERGYTIVETVVTMAIIASVLTVSLAILSIEKSSRFDSESQGLLASLRQMQSQAQTVDNNQEYGVSFGSTSYTSFSRDPATGATTNLKTTNLSASSLSATVTPPDTKIVFARLTGKPSGGAAATLTLSRTNPTKNSTILVTSAGVIYVQ